MTFGTRQCRRRSSSFSADVFVVVFGLPCRVRHSVEPETVWGKTRGEVGAELLGLEGLLHHQQVDVNNGNLLLNIVSKMCLYAEGLGIPWYIENPATSRAWLVPIIQRLSSRPSSVFVRLDWCQYGARWRKATGILCGHHPDLKDIGRTCHFLEGYRCNASRKKAHRAFRKRSSGNSLDRA